MAQNFWTLTFFWSWWGQGWTSSRAGWTEKRHWELTIILYFYSNKSYHYISSSYGDTSSHAFVPRNAFLVTLWKDLISTGNSSKCQESSWTLIIILPSRSGNRPSREDLNGFWPTSLSPAWPVSDHRKQECRLIWGRSPWGLHKSAVLHTLTTRNLAVLLETEEACFSPTANPPPAPRAWIWKHGDSFF